MYVPIVCAYCVCIQHHRINYTNGLLTGHYGPHYHLKTLQKEQLITHSISEFFFFKVFIYNTNLTVFLWTDVICVHV